MSVKQQAPSSVHNRRAAARRPRRQEQAPRQRRLVGLAAAGIVLALAVLVAARLLSAPPAATSDGPVPPEVTNVPASTFEQIGRGAAVSLPVPVRAAVSHGPTGTPLVTYIGAEYCPFCAGQRWSLIVALSRFGQFADLKTSHSAGDDVFPNTPTFAFVGSSYSSPYLDFSPVELQTNVRSGSTYTPLQTPTPDQAGVLREYDAPPYVPASSAGAIPFVDIADQYVISGASYDVGVLRGQSLESIAQSLADPSSPRAQAIVGGANVITAAVCTATGNTPGEVCGQSAIQSLEATLASTPVPSGA